VKTEKYLHCCSYNYLYLCGMKKELIAADSRGRANHGWLRSNFSFSFSHYYDPERVHFGMLRVLNDDWIAAGEGFPMHPHDNMEIVTLVLNGAVAHEDTTGGKDVIRKGQIQMMHAGKGLQHSEFNASETESLELLQMWVFPKWKDVQPGYETLTISDLMRPNELVSVVSHDGRNGSLVIQQDAAFHVGFFEEDIELNWQPNQEGNGVHFFQIEGNSVIEGQSLSKRDALQLWDFEGGLSLKVQAGSHLLAIEVPTKLG
jgi:redox-sensitive bicupin YhaK (pirin superfamily)